MFDLYIIGAVMCSPSFGSENIIGAIFKKTVEREIAGIAPKYLWEQRKVVPFLK